MIENLRKYPVATTAFIAFYYGVGIVGLSIDNTRAIFTALVPFTLLFSLYFLWLFQEGLNARFYLASLSILVLGIVVEVAGVNTGVIFGKYVYGKTLGIKLWNTPLLIGVNWLLLIVSSRALAEKFISNRLLKILAASAMMVIYDIALEPVAIRLDMWNWFGEPVPLQNYIAWFVVSALLFTFFEFSVKRTSNKIAPALFIIQLVFFLALNIIYKFS